MVTSPFQEDAGVISVFTQRVLQECHGVVRGYDLRHQLGEDHHEDTSQEPSLQEHWPEPVRDGEEEVVLGLGVDGGQLGGEEHDEHHEHLPAHEELLHVVRLGGHLTQLVSMRMTVAVGLRILPLQLNQGNLSKINEYESVDEDYDDNLESLHESEPEEESEEEQERGPSWNVVPEASLLLDDGVECADAGEDEEKSADNEARIVKTLGLGELDHDGVVEDTDAGDEEPEAESALHQSPEISGETCVGELFLLWRWSAVVSDADQRWIISTIE